MRALVLAKLKEMFDEGDLTNLHDEEVTDFAAEVESLSDADLLDLFEWSVGFQG